MIAYGSDPLEEVLIKNKHAGDDALHSHFDFCKGTGSTSGEFLSVQ